MSLDISQLAQDLPLDIFKYMLETTALRDRIAARNLVLVSKAIRSWIDPILYRTVVLQSFYTFAQCIRQKNNPEFFHRNVKSLCITSIKPPEQFTALEVEDEQLVLCTCTGVVSLALWRKCPRNLSSILTPPAGMEIPQPTYMSFLHLPRGLDIGSLCTSNVTVLDFQLENIAFASSIPAWNTLLSSCQNPTTLLLSDNQRTSDVASSLITAAVTSILSCPQKCLQSIILRPSDMGMHYEGLLDHLQALDDSRIVVVPTSPFHDSTSAFIQRTYPELVLFLPDLATLGGNDDQIIRDWGYAPPHVEKLWERVEHWKQGGRYPTVQNRFFDEFLPLD